MTKKCNIYFRKKKLQIQYDKMMQEMVRRAWSIIISFYRIYFQFNIIVFKITVQLWMCFKIFSYHQYSIKIRITSYITSCAKTSNFLQQNDLGNGAERVVHHYLLDKNFKFSTTKIKKTQFQRPKKTYIHFFFTKTSIYFPFSIK